MSSKGNVTQHCKLILWAISAVLVINVGLTGSPGRAITKDYMREYQSSILPFLSLVKADISNAVDGC